VAGCLRGRNDALAGKVGGLGRLARHTRVEVVHEEERHALGGHGGAREDLARHGDQGLPRLRVYGRRVELVVVPAGAIGLPVHARGVVPAGGELAPEALEAVGVAVQDGGEHARLARGAEHERAGTVPEVRRHRRRARRVVEGGRVDLGTGDQHALRGAVPEVRRHRRRARRVLEGGRVDLGTRDQHALRGARAHEAVRGGEREESAGALGAHVERPHRPAAELLLEEAAGAGEGDVGRHGGEDDEIDVGRPEARAGERGERGLARQVRGAVSVVGVMPARDPGQLREPRARRAEVARELFVGDGPRWQVAAAAEDGARRHCRPYPPAFGRMTSRVLSR